MAKWKAILIDAVITVLLIGLLYVGWEYSLDIFFVFGGLFAVYGFGQFVYVLYTWLAAPSQEIKRVNSKDPPFKVPPVSEAWVNPFKQENLFTNKSVDDIIEEVHADAEIS